MIGVSAKPVVLRLRVDPIACDAFGYCAELLPEMVGVDEWGYPVLDDTPVPTELLELAERAVRDCPRRALILERIERIEKIERVRGVEKIERVQGIEGTARIGSKRR